MSVKLRERKLAKGAIKYYLDIYHHGDREYEFLDIVVFKNDSKDVKAEKKNIANLIRSNRELELISENTTYVPKHLRNINFNDFAKSFIDNYNKKDLRMIEATLKKFNEYIKNDRLKLSEVTPSIMNGYKDYLNDSAKLNGETPHNYFTRFKKILKDAELKGLIKDNPARNIKFQKKNNSEELKKQVLSTDELKTLANTECGNENIKTAFLFACYTGLGYAEIKILKWKQIKDNRLITKREKTSQKVEIKLKDKLINLLGERKEKEDYVFLLLNDRGQSISDNGVNKCLKNWVKRAKIDKHITFYCARHTFATQLLIYGANLKTVADALGHTNTRNTIKYLNYIDSLKDEAIDNLPDINF
ncbi:tyrosine-type recombinase/integrase [Corallibacter sp.]|uniref:tyrosine-type recombinase/integrase n=1 Tax=Corallibacter sp. TaxID=2038084 RepID=UPI003AB480D2